MNNFLKVISHDYKEFKYLCIEILVQLGKLLKKYIGVDRRFTSS